MLCSIRCRPRVHGFYLPLRFGVGRVIPDEPALNARFLNIFVYVACDEAITKAAILGPPKKESCNAFND